MITASAVSEETVAPAAPRAIPQSATASAGASLMPSPTMTTGARSGARAHAADDAELVLGRLVGVDGVEPEHRPQRSGDLLAVTGDHRDTPHAGTAQAPDQSRGLGPDGIRHDDLAGEGSSIQTAITMRPGSPSSRATDAPSWAAPTDTTAAPTRPRTPRPGVSTTSVASSRSSPRSRAARTTAPAVTWTEYCSTDAAMAKQRVVGQAVDRHDPLDLDGAAGQCAGLVEQHRARAAELLDDPAAFDDDPDPRGPGDAGDQRDGRGEDQGTRRRDDEHGDGAAPHRPRWPMRPRRRWRVKGNIKTANRSARRTNGARCDWRPARAGRSRRRHSQTPDEARATRTSRRRSRFRSRIDVAGVDDHRQRLAGRRRLVDDRATPMATPSAGASSPARTTTMSPGIRPHRPVPPRCRRVPDQRGPRCALDQPVSSRRADGGQPLQARCRRPA